MKMLSQSNVILLVEDEVSVRMVVNDLLEELGFRVVAAQCGDAALPILESNIKIDLLLTDVRMPGRLNGFDLIEEAARLRPDLMTIAMSGYTGESATRKSIADRFIAKPFTQIALSREIESLLSGT